MAQAAASVNHQLLARFTPINSLSSDNLSDLARKAQLVTVAAGRPLFKQGERDNQTLYLVEGQVELRDGQGNVRTLTGNTADARQALAPGQPRQASAVARTEATVLKIDNDLLDILLTWDQSAGYVVAELEDDAQDSATDWMTAMLQSGVFHQVPPANIQEIFKRLEPLPVQAGEEIIRQGEPGDYYYILRQGRAQVSRKAPNGADIPLATLNQGDGFGEEALITESERNASVRMLDEGMLMRLSKSDFNDLMTAPLLEEVTLEEGQARTAAGAKWLDVRLESEYAAGAISGSLNIPLCLLRLRMRELDANTPYIVYCDTGRRSAAAAYLLSESGFEVSVLKEGYNPEAAAA